MKATLLTLALLSVSVVAVNGQQNDAVGAVKLSGNSINKVERRSFLQPQKITLQLNKTALSNESMKRANAAIAKAESDVSAMYAIPEGTYFIGTTPLGYTSYYPTIVAPAFVDLEWGNYSSGNLTSVNWEYGITDASVNGDDTKYYSDDVHLTVNYPYFAYSYMPVLTVSDGSNTSSYQRKWSGTLPQVGAVTLNGMINTLGYELDDDSEMFNGLTPQPFYEGAMTIGAGESSDETWFGKNSLTTAQGITGYGLFVPKPASPLFVSHIYMHAINTLQIADGAQLRMDIYSAEGGKISVSDENFIISAYCDAADIVNVADEGADPYYYLPFYFMEEDDYGFLSPVDFILNQDVFIVFSSFMSDNDVTRIDFPVSANVSDEGVTSYTGWILLENGRMLQIANMFQGVNYYTAPDISLCAYFGVLKFDDNSYVAPVQGGTFSTNYQSNFILDAAEFTGDGLGDWYDYSYTEATQQNPVSTLQITVDPLPSGVTGRSSILNVSLYGGNAQITITQGTAGVDVVETGANRVSVVGGNFEVEAGNATSVDVYNVAGQKVASAAIEGTATIPAQDLAKGLYILRFNDNSVVKVMK